MPRLNVELLGAVVELPSLLERFYCFEVEHHRHGGAITWESELRWTGRGYKAEDDGAHCPECGSTGARAYGSVPRAKPVLPDSLPGL